MAETITLPRSGVVLTPRGEAHGFFALSWEGNLLSLSIGVWNPNGQMAPLAEFGRCRHVAPLDECIAWLDERVLALRAALLPADARDRVANALIAEWMKDRALDAALKEAGL